MAEDTRNRPSLRDQDAADIRNAQRAGIQPAGPGGEGQAEPSDLMQRVWSDPGGEAYNYRNALVGAGGKSDDHSELTAAETPETHRHLSDASLPKPEPHQPAETLGQPEAGPRPGEG